MPSASVQQTVIWVEEAAKKNHLFALLGDPKHYALVVNSTEFLTLPLA